MSTDVPANGIRASNAPVTPPLDTAKTGVANAPVTPPLDTAKTGVANAPVTPPLEDTAKTGVANAPVTPPLDTAKTGVANAPVTPPLDTAKTGVANAPVTPPLDTAKTGVANAPVTPPLDTAAQDNSSTSINAEYDYMFVDYFDYDDGIDFEDLDNEPPFEDPDYEPLTEEDLLSFFQSVFDAEFRQVVDKDRRELEEKLNQVEHRYMPITHFYHVTTTHNKEKIISEAVLRGNIANLIHQSKRSPINKMLEGVFFGCNLWDNGDLPMISPYGTERVEIPVHNFLRGTPHLFYSSSHETRPGFTYVILVLVNESDPEYQFCKCRLKELDMEDNSILKIDRLGELHAYYHSTERNKFSLIIEVFVVGDVPLPRWNTVKDIGRARTRSN